MYVEPPAAVGTNNELAAARGEAHATYLHTGAYMKIIGRLTGMGHMYMELPTAVAPTVSQHLNTVRCDGIVQQYSDLVRWWSTCLHTTILLGLWGHPTSTILAVLYSFLNCARNLQVGPMLQRTLCCTT